MRFQPPIPSAHLLPASQRTTSIELFEVPLPAWRTCDFNDEEEAFCDALCAAFREGAAPHARSGDLLNDYVAAALHRSPGDGGVVARLGAAEVRFRRSRELDDEEEEALADLEGVFRGSPQPALLPEPPVTLRFDRPKRPRDEGDPPPPPAAHVARAAALGRATLGDARGDDSAAGAADWSRQIRVRLRVANNSPREHLTTYRKKTVWCKVCAGSKQHSAHSREGRIPEVPEYKNCRLFVPLYVPA